MQENGIGSQLAQFYEAYSVVLEKKRDFVGASQILLLGKEINAQPPVKLDECINKFEYRMRSRLKRDFYEKGFLLKDNENSDSTFFQLSEFNAETQFPLVNPIIKSLENHSVNIKKRRYPFEEEEKTSHYYGRPSPKKQKMNPFINTISTGAFRIYVDEPFRSIIPTVTKLVSEYQTLCMKYQFQRNQDPPKTKNTQLSWISLEKQPKIEKILYNSALIKPDNKGRENMSEKNWSILSESFGCYPGTFNATRLNPGSFDLGNLAEYLVNDEKTSRNDSKYLESKEINKAFSTEFQQEYERPSPIKFPYKKTPFCKIASTDKIAPKYLVNSSGMLDGSNTKYSTTSVEKISLNVSRSLNFEEDSAIPESIRMNDDNIQRFQKSPFCRGLFDANNAEDAMIITNRPQKCSKSKQIQHRPPKIEFLRSSDHQIQAIPSSDFIPTNPMIKTTATAVLEEICALPKSGDKLEDLEFAKFMHKLLQSPSHITSTNTLRNIYDNLNSPALLPSKSIREQLIRDENQKDENLKNDFTKTLASILQDSIESDKVNYFHFSLT